MSEASHNDAFIAVRDVVLAVNDGDRRAIARMFGAMHEPQADPTPAQIAALRAIAALSDEDIVRLARWFRRYVNRWGQVPIASSRRVDPKAQR